MKTQPTESDLLLEQVKKEMKKRGVSLHQMSLQAGCHYGTLYWIFHPEKRMGGNRVGPPRFSYNVGKKIESWISNRKTKAKNQ